MRNALLLLAAGVSWPCSAALAQSRPDPAYLLRQFPSAPRLPLGLPVALPTVAPIPTRRAAAAYAYLVMPAAPAGASLPVEVNLRRDLTGNRGFPVYDQYQNLPETFRKYTLPAATPPPWPVQLLQGLL